MKDSITRRQLLKALGAAAVGYGLGTGKPRRTVMARSMAQGSVAEIPLQAGWNLISMPLTPDSSILPGVLTSISGKYDIVYEFDGSGGGQTWNIYSPSMPAILNSLSALDIRKGYWIHTNQAATLTLVGTQPSSTSIPLIAGWNLVGYPSNEERSVTEALAALDGNYTEVRTFAGGMWRTYIPGGTATLTELEPGRGYWIRMTSPATWVVPGSTSGGPAVIHIHDDGATSWNGSSTNYWDYVNQSVVNDMVDRGVQELTGAATVAQAWQALIPSYQPGQGIAIKLNFNNTFSCDNTEGAIDGIIHPVNGVVRGLKQMGVQESDIWVYDAIRALPDRFVNGCQYSGVRFFDSGCRTGAGFYGTSDPNAEVAFNPPGGVPSPAGVYISDVLINATYLINMPIMKTHCCTGISLGFKNHYGTINDPGALHDQAFLAEGSYRSDYSPTVDLFQNPHIANKTVLTIGDGIFAALVFDMGPSQWATFGNQVPESLFFATDPVAIDCVLCDFLAAETSIPAGSDDYLNLAGNAGIGTYERGDPWGSGYSQIDYRRIDI